MKNNIAMRSATYGKAYKPQLTFHCRPALTAYALVADVGPSHRCKKRDKKIKNVKKRKKRDKNKKTFVNVE